MKTSTLLFFCLLLSVTARTQCLTDFTKLLPEPSHDYTLNYGSAFAMHGNYLAIGLPAHDSLGRITGLVYVYEKALAGWKKIATLTPSDPVDALQFGLNVEMSSDYLLVSAYSSVGGKVYVFKKPATGWISQTELTSFTYPHTAFFGVPYSMGVNEPVDISEDQQTIAITDIWYNYQSSQRHGAVFVYHKQPDQEWDGSMVPVKVEAPEDDASDFGRPGVVIHGDRIITGTPYSPNGNGKLYVYRDPSGEFNNLQFEATIAGANWPENFWLGYYRFTCTDEGIFVSMTTDLDTSPKIVIAFFEMPASGEWSDAIGFTCSFSPGGNINSKTLPVISARQDGLVVSYQASDGNGYTTLVRKGAAGWCDPTYEDIDFFVPAEEQKTNRYGAVNAAADDHVAISILPHPEQVQANTSLKVMSHNDDGSWSSELMFPKKKTTAGHAYGRAILGFEDFLFVGAPYDGTVKQSAGAVYVYRKTGNVWNKSGKILAPVDEPGDNVFGTAIATNGTQVAIGAMGFGDYGRVFIYRKKQSDWSDVELVQEIQLPEHMLTVFSYGDNLAMSNEWLLIPYVQNSPARIMLAIYKRNGELWEYSQVVEATFGSIFAKFSTKAVAIEGSTIVIGNVILELNPNGLWERRYVLSPSDPESAQIAPDFSHWIRNGSMFGHDVAISNNSIFISAPNKDYGDTWDVGAVYIYTKKPWESWSSRTETAKVIPRVKDERELFGYSLNVFGNTLIVGAPGADYNVDGSARNKPGRAYVFQTEDYFWQQVNPLIDFTGDSFVKDYFGMGVGLDESDFFITAPIEDIETGKLSGSVYVTAAPPIIKLVPPVCSSEASIDLFGYPFGGTWSGPGLTDAREGTFDPKVAGVGEHIFTYTTESCTYLGKLKIRVEAPVHATLAVEPEHLVCESSTSVNVPLAVNKHEGYQYLWYHRDDAGEPFFPLNAKEANLTALYRGEYMAKVFNEICMAFSPAVTIRNEHVDLTLDPVARICQDVDEGIALSGSPVGGTWTGAGIQNNRLYSKSLSNGLHTIQYQYRSPLGCKYTDQIAVEVDRVPLPVVTRTSGNLCIEGTVELTMAPNEQDINYTWQHRAPGAADFVSMNAHDGALTAEERGAYRVQAADGACVATSKAISITDHTFQLEIKPEGASLLKCDGAAQLLTVSPVAGRTYDWYYMESENGESALVGAGSQNELSADVSGYYYAVVQSGKCEMQTPVKQVTIRAEDHITFPNIITANGDPYNEVFTVQTNTEIIDVRIMNRYGKLVYSGVQAEYWNVHEVSSGVYFPLVIYKTCEGEIAQLKGVVHVISD